MEKYSFRTGAVCAAFLVITAAVLLCGTEIFRGMRDSVDACLYTMIPSLYAMMICSEIFISSGIAEYTARFFHKPARFIFGADGQVLVIFLFSQAAGYPVGARMICRLYEKGQLSRTQASWLSGVCYGGGPAFLSALFADNSRHGLYIFIASTFSNLLIFTAMCRPLKLKCKNAPHNSSLSSGTSLVEAAASSGAALLKICSMVIVFGGIAGLLEGLGLNRLFPENIYRYILGFAEISRITGCFPYASYELPVLGAALSFGGICVLMQLNAVTEGKLNMTRITAVRMTASLLTWVQLYLWQSFFPSEDAVHTAVTNVQSFSPSDASPLPSLLLLIMTTILLLSTDRSVYGK